jgi:hypothetical protein
MDFVMMVVAGYLLFKREKVMEPEDEKVISGPWRQIQMDVPMVVENASRLWKRWNGGKE